ncbi:hypothetical protein HF324_05415 [Chitinophaga oryzae]|uniref:DUF2214 domain-containing protein n=1 Tax=Chitinophaga oryzae TaxID=2725414 RepID=A0AAE6ZD81_9BACT|nr:hypothetical protein [Chitinophaga oryzae]QJB30828.1 hypothetical protein HF329_05740 [Chitinophaga oryzae]QJB37319.1 hypothetical protein HF324_05415 [Chitinophaga oryzae]
MNTYLLSLLTHIIGLAMVAGIVLAGFLANRRFWKIYATDRTRAVAILDLTARFPVAMGIGMLLLLVSGTIMMAQVHGVYGEQLWFRIKMVMFLLVIVNGIMGRRLGLKMKPVLQSAASNENIGISLEPLKARLNLFYILQLLLLLAIFSCGVLKFT